MNEFLLVATTHLVGLVSPGPDIALVIKTSLNKGRKYGMLCAVGLGAAMAVHILGVVAGYGALLAANSALYSAVRLVGAGYLIYLGVAGLSSLRKSRSSNKDPLDQKAGRRRSFEHPFVLGFMTNITNPKFTLFIVLLYTQIVSPTTGTVPKLLYGVWMVAVAVTWFSIAAVGFGSSRVQKVYSRIGKWVDVVFAVILLLLGVAVFEEVVRG